MFDQLAVYLFGKISFANRGERILTSDLLVPNQALYQVKLRPDILFGEKSFANTEEEGFEPSEPFGSAV